MHNYNQKIVFSSLLAVSSNALAHLHAGHVAYCQYMSDRLDCGVENIRKELVLPL